jgi:hypothetical protein
MATRGIVGAMSFKGGNDKNALLTYIKQVLVPNLSYIKGFKTPTSTRSLSLSWGLNP